MGAAKSVQSSDSGAVVIEGENGTTKVVRKISLSEFHAGAHTVNAKADVCRGGDADEDYTSLPGTGGHRSQVGHVLLEERLFGKSKWVASDFMIRGRKAYIYPKHSSSHDHSQESPKFVFLLASIVEHKVEEGEDGDFILTFHVLKESHLVEVKMKCVEKEDHASKAWMACFLEMATKEHERGVKVQEEFRKILQGRIAH